MPMNFWTGVIVGVVGVYAFHRFVAPMPGGKQTAGRG